MKFKIFILLIAIFTCLQAFATDEKSQLATAYYSDNNYAKTMESLLNIPASERTAQDWLILGNLYEEKNDNKKACLMYQKAANLKPDYYKAYYNLASVYCKKREYYTAIYNYKKALKYNKTNAYVYYNYGCACIKTGNLKKAQSLFEQAIILQNNIPEFHYNMAYVCKRLHKDKMAQDYLTNYNKLLEMN